MLNHLQAHDSVYRNTQWSAAQKGVLTDMLSEHDFKCIWAAHNRPMCCAKMIGAVYKSWFSNVDALKKHFGIKDGIPMTEDERAVMAANVGTAKLHMERQLELISNCNGGTQLTCFASTKVRILTQKAVTACERIVRSNVPASYSRHTSRFLSIWCFTLPLVLVHPYKWLMIPTQMIICWSLFIIEEVGNSIEDPFNVHLYTAGLGEEDVLIIEGSQVYLKFICFTGTKVQILTLMRLPGESPRGCFGSQPGTADSSHRCGAVPWR
jgi:predicted membrane chloride channel (bestrophin family)